MRRRLFNLRVALAEAGFHADVALLPEPEDASLPALVRTRPSDDGEDAGLRLLEPAVRQRHTSRYPFAEKAIPDDVRTALIDAARSEEAVLSFPESWQARWVEELAKEAEARNLTDPGSEQDLARWTRIGAGEADTATDGVPEYAFGPGKHGGRAPMPRCTPVRWSRTPAVALPYEGVRYRHRPAQRAPQARGPPRRELGFPAASGWILIASGETDLLSAD
ncbi:MULTISPECIES: hypothetical protein [Streptomyces]|uniref:Uncharacterized protein n=1 Tax=Streptomyces griseocarneus TaxID=51201 RepID=A0ABX7RPU8_9ACTN|nr:MULTISPECIES: hypothetical protein [Streptomyces]QSY49822.1 hypothetical protein J3S04_01540 [Streptomyces griseocarneus]